MDKKTLFAHWGIDKFEIADDIVISGSPNRSLERCVLKCASGEMFIAEGFSISKREKQIKQNTFLEHLQKENLQGIYPFLRSSDGGHGVEDGTFFWQLRPYLPMDELPRATLGEAGELGALWGRFLLDFKKASSSYDRSYLPNERFFLASYIPLLRALIIHQMPQILRKFDMLVRKLSAFFEIERTLPSQISHGDFHPGNILISGGEISGVIDWEFCGLKCAGYDPALLLGCLGIDDPGWLGGKAAEIFRQMLFEADFMPRISWEHFTSLMAAIRLGWLGEWVDMRDRDLAERELEYIEMLSEF